MNPARKLSQNQTLIYFYNWHYTIFDVISIIVFKYQFKILVEKRYKGKKFHPVLKIYHPHHGIDYAASKGTPIKIIGDESVYRKNNSVV